MGKVKFTAFVAEIRNKVNGSVFSKNRSGNYIRNKVTPVNPQTADQVAKRSQLASWAQGWRGLTQAQRDAWNSAVQDFKGTDIFGDIKIPSGINLYTKLNMNLDQISAANISSPPLPDAVDPITSLSITPNGTAGTFTVTFTPTPVPAGHTWIVEATAPVSVGKSFVKSEYRQITTLAAATATGASIFTAWSNKFGTLTVGQKVFVRITPVLISTGQRGLPLSASEIVV